MKKRIKVTAVLFCTLLSFLSVGQSLNIKSGYTMSTIKYEGFSDINTTEVYDGTTYTRKYNHNMISGFNTSIGYEFRLGKRLSLETGIKYQTRGYEIVDSYTMDDGVDSFYELSTTKMKLNYFDIPIVLNTSILLGNVNVYARTGIYGGFLVMSKYNSRYEYSYSSGDQGEEESSGSLIDYYDAEERIAGGILLGFGAEYKGFYFETNYTIGVLSLTYLDEAYTQDLSFSIGYKIKFKK